MGYLLTYMSAQHLYGMYIDFGGFNMDVTTYTMILVTKLWGLSWAYADGAKIQKDLTPDQNQRKVVHFPTILEYLAFVYYCCGCMCAPFIEFSDFKNWIELSGHYKTLPRGPGGVPKTIVPLLKRVLAGIMCLAFHLGVSVGLGIVTSTVGKPDFAQIGSMWYKIYYYFIAMTGQRFIYYVPWCFTDAANIAAGLSYSGSVVRKDGQEEHEWKQINCVFVYDLETSKSASELTKYWNH